MFMCLGKFMFSFKFSFKFKKWYGNNSWKTLKESVWKPSSVFSFYNIGQRRIQNSAKHLGWGVLD